MGYPDDVATLRVRFSDAGCRPNSRGLLSLPMGGDTPKMTVF
jgi:hypothetical protein